MTRLTFLPIGSALALAILAAPPTALADEPVGWNKTAAATYLDARAQTWFAFGEADRGTGASKTSCVCCHTVVPYAIARPALRKLTGHKQATAEEQKLRAQTLTRVAGWSQLDTPEYGLLYDFNEEKKRESRGTEAVLNALMLAFGDQHEGRHEPSAATQSAFANLWPLQSADGDSKGAFEWLDFELEPWEGKNSRYFGAALAAVAIGTAPGYYVAGKDANLDERVNLLTKYLKQHFAEQSLFHRAWTLSAASNLSGILTKEEQQQVVTQLLAKQRPDGGWSLSSLGPYIRSDGTPQDASSDGYATGLLLNILLDAIVPQDTAGFAKGLKWLRTHQQPDGSWRGVSVNQKRDSATHVGKFMSDAATAYAVLALSRENNTNPN